MSDPLQILFFTVQNSATEGGEGACNVTALNYKKCEVTKIMKTLDNFGILASSSC
jgi:hypothetical protein